jgi:hypothetical protein
MVYEGRVNPGRHSRREEHANASRQSTAFLGYTAWLPFDSTTIASARAAIARLTVRRNHAVVRELKSEIIQTWMFVWTAPSRPVELAI